VPQSISFPVVRAGTRRDALRFMPMRPPPFTCEPVPERDRVRIHVTGEIDIGTIDVVRATVEEMLAAGFRRLVLDLRDVTFMDSTALHLMLALDADARRDGIAFSVMAGPPHVHRVLAVAGVAERLTFEPA
jgi:anti-anti-sigma factor